MARSTCTVWLAALAILCALQSTHAAYKLYGGVYQPPNSTETVRTFISYTTYGRVGAMGAEFSSGFLDPAHLASLPMNRYPLVGAPSFVSGGRQPFMWQGIREILLPWPTGGHELSPYAYMRLLYNPSGHPAGGLVPTQLGMWDMSQWLMSYEYLDRNMTNAYWAHDPYPRGPCFGMAPSSFWDVFQPVAVDCFVKRPFANYGDAQYGHTVHLTDLSAPEWNPIQPFNTTVLWGTFNGTVSSLQFQIRTEIFGNASYPATCMPVYGTPSRAPQERRTPRRFCWFELPNNNTVFQIDNFYTIPRGDCTVSRAHPASRRSYFPPLFANIAQETLNISACRFPREEDYPTTRR